MIVFPTPPAVVGAVPVHDLLFWEASDRARYPRRDTLGLSVARLVLQALGAIMAYGWFVVKRDDGGLAEAGLMVSWRALRVKVRRSHERICLTHTSVSQGMVLLLHLVCPDTSRIRCLRNDTGSTTNTSRNQGLQTGNALGRFTNWDPHCYPLFASMGLDLILSDIFLLGQAGLWRVDHGASHCHVLLDDCAGLVGPSVVRVAVL